MCSLISTLNFQCALTLVQWYFGSWALQHSSTLIFSICFLKSLNFCFVISDIVYCTFFCFCFVLLNFCSSGRCVLWVLWRASACQPLAPWRRPLMKVLHLTRLGTSFSKSPQLCPLSVCTSSSSSSLFLFHSGPLGWCWWLVSWEFVLSSSSFFCGSAGQSIPVHFSPTGPPSWLCPSTKYSGSSWGSCWWMFVVWLLFVLLFSMLLISAASPASR